MSKNNIIKIMLAMLFAAGGQIGVSAQLSNVLKQAQNTIMSSGVSRGVDMIINQTEKAATKASKKKKKTNKKEKQAIAQEQIWTFGEHIYTVSGQIEDKAAAPGQYKGTAFVTFTHVPSDFEEFQALYNEFLGLTPHGTAAMIAMAIEIYARDNNIGKECMELLCGQSAAMSNLRILNTKLPKPGQNANGDNYVQRYLPAAILKGATAANAYTPESPYTVEMCARPNAPQNTDYTYFYILGGGWDTYYRPVAVKLLDDSHYRLSECSSVYSQCQNIKGEWPGLQ